MAYETFDKDLREGKAREDAFVHVLLRSRVEHKRDKKFLETGNIALEFEQRTADGSVRPSGVAVYSERFAVEWAPECWLIIPTDVARNIARHAYAAGRHAWVGDGGNHHNALVPVSWFFEPKYWESPRPRATDALVRDLADMDELGV